MKTKYIFILGASLVLAGFLFIPEANAKGKAGNFANGAKLWVDTCQRCHNLRNTKDHNDSELYTVMMHMRVRAGLTGQDTRDILAFLRASNGD